jgi:hypothetical protein
VAARTYGFSETQQQQLMETMLEFLNHFSGQVEVLQKLTAVIKSLCQHRDINRIVLTAACTALASVAVMADLVEFCIARHFQGNAALDLDNHYGWTEIVHRRLQVPELFADELIEAALGDHAALTLFAIGLQELSRCTDLEQEMAVTRRIVKWATAMRPVTERESKIMLLVHKSIELLSRQLSMSCSAAHVEQCLVKLCQYLIEVANAKTASTFLWIGAKPVHSVRMRLACLSLAAFLQLQLTDVHSLRLQGAPRCKLALKMVAQIESDKEFVTLAEHKDVLESLKDPDSTLFVAPSLSSMLALRLLQDNFLAVCR